MFSNTLGHGHIKNSEIAKYFWSVSYVYPRKFTNLQNQKKHKIRWKLVECFLFFRKNSPPNISVSVFLCAPTYGWDKSYFVKFPVTVFFIVKRHLISLGWRWKCAPSAENQSSQICYFTWSCCRYARQKPKKRRKKNTVDRTLSREMRGIVDFCVQATKLKSTFLFFFLSRSRDSPWVSLSPRFAEIFFMIFCEMLLQFVGSVHELGNLEGFHCTMSCYIFE